MSKSYKVVHRETGEGVMTIIVSDHWTLKNLNKLLQTGMNVVVTDERSALVDKRYVDVKE